MVGNSLSHYQIEEELGRGGMGIVYRARDTKLDRTVAIKVLPPAALSSEEDRARFYREAKAAAQLHHPHIASVFEIDEAVPGGSKDDDLRPFISMEYIEGETLSERIKKGPLKLEDAVRIASQIASGLEVAHEKEIVHRDLKSQNVMLTSKGEAKILDFGLAQTAASTKLTRMGSTLGTVAYMSPEQARGEEVDRRTDLWSLGVVLYEMIAGQSPFPGDYEQAVVYEILNTDPEPLTAVRTGVPMQLEWLVNKLLTKSADERYQSAREIIVDLSSVDSVEKIRSTRVGPGSSSLDAVPPDSRINNPLLSKRSALVFAGFISCIVLGVFIGSWRLSRTQRQETRNVVRSSLVLPDGEPLGFVGAAPLYLGRTALALSEDGNLLAYAAEFAPGETKLIVRRLDELGSRIIPNTDGAYAPFFSPDGSQLGFFADDKLKIIPLSGGAATALADARNPIGGVWAPGGFIVVSDNEGSRLHIVSVRDGSGRPLPVAARAPSLLPGGEYILATDYSKDDRDGVIIRISDGNLKRLGLGSSQNPVISPRYVASGHLIFTQNAQLMAVAFDARTMEVKGRPVSVVQNVRDEALNYGGQYAVSQTGTLVYASGGDVDLGKLVAVNSRGEETVLPFKPERFGEMRLSPDGSRLAIGVLGTSMNIWIYDLLEMSDPLRLTFEGDNSRLAWDPEGSWVYFSSNRDGAQGIYRASISESGTEERITVSSGPEYPTAVSPDGKWLLYSALNSETVRDIEAIAISDEAMHQVVAKTQFSEWGGTFSPDGKSIAYLSDEAGTYDVYAKPFTEELNRTRLSTRGGMDPIWSRDGKSVYYNYVQDIYRVDVDPERGYEHNPPVLLFTGNYLDLSGAGWAYDEQRDRFILAKSVEEAKTTTQLVVVSNWFDELTRLVPPAE